MSQNRIYASPFYSPQDNVFGTGRGPYDYGSNIFLQEKDVLPSCRQTSMGLNGQSHITQDYNLDPARNGAQEQKGNVHIYPWMQRMNSHTGKFLLGLGERMGWFYYMSQQQCEILFMAP